MKNTKASEAPNQSYYMGDLFGELSYAEDVVQPTPIRAMVPGLVVAAIAAMAAAFLGLTYGFPLMLAGLLFGFSLSFVARDSRTHAGLDFASRSLLRLGIILLGLQVTARQVMELGLAPFGALLAVMIAAFAGALLVARLVGLNRESGVLAGGATAICGISAALALYGVIGDKRVSQAQFTITLVGITLASAIALTFYPLIAQWLSLSDEQAGFLTGAAIHDVAQAIGGGYAVSDGAGATATVVKLARVALLAPLVALLALWLKSSTADADDQAQPVRFVIPSFIVLFLALATVNSIVEIPETARALGLTVSKALLLMAVVSAAIRSDLSFVMEAGWRTIAPVAGATLTSFAVALAAAYFVI